MSDHATTEHVARLVEPGSAETVEILGPTVAFLTSPDEGDDVPLVLRGTLPAGIVVPLHSHADPETAIAVSGEAEALVEAGDGFEWVRVAAGDVFHIPGGAKHAWRNRSQEPAVHIHVTTTRLGRFFREVGTPVAAGDTTAASLSGQALGHFLETAERYGHWLATPEENAAVGLALPVAG